MDFATEFDLLNKRSINESSGGVVIYARHEFLKTRTALAVPVVVILLIASVVGTLGNVLTLAVICSNRLGRNVTTTFIMNLAMSDLFVTLIVDPMSLLGRLLYMYKTRYLSHLKEHINIIFNNNYKPTK